VAVVVVVTVQVVLIVSEVLGVAGSELHQEKVDLVLQIQDRVVVLVDLVHHITLGAVQVVPV
jgi:hypothetical protein